MIFCRRSSAIDKKTIKKLSSTHLKLLDASELINQTLSPIMLFSFAFSFSMLCIFVFSLFIFAEEFWIVLPWVAISDAALNIHLVLLTIGAVWMCESTVNQERSCQKNLFKILMEADIDQQLQVTVFVQQLSTNKLKFSCGLFDFNWNLCFRVCSTKAFRAFKAHKECLFRFHRCWELQSFTS